MKGSPVQVRASALQEGQAIDGWGQMTFIRLGEIPPPLWSVVLCVCIGAGIIYLGSVRLGVGLIIAILLVSAPRLWRRS